LKMLHHPNCVEMKQYFYTNGEKPDEVYLNVVMDFIPDTVYKVMKSYYKMK
jgi:glycogen synthase kinase 3 beta